jgi:aarF domain-containing kinase
MVAGRFLDLMTRSGMAIVDYKLHGLLYKKKEEDGEEEDENEKAARHKLHTRNAESMYEACAQHGGLLVKMGQYLATTASTVLPTEYSNALARLQDNCAPMEYEQVRECIEAELSRLHGSKTPSDGVSTCWIDQIFDEIKERPLGSASLAQVHAATLKDGRRVALKVQRPNLNRTTMADLLALSILSKAVERAFPGSNFDWML